MFKGVCQCFPAVGILYFDHFNPFHFSPLPFYLSLPISTSLNTNPYIPSIHIFYVLWYYWYYIILFSFPSFSMFHTVVLLWLTYSTYEFVYEQKLIWVYEFLCICLFFGSIFHVWEKTCGLCFSEPALLHLACIFQLHPFTFSPHTIIPYGWIKLHFVYIPHFLDQL
jgi:hypothetical protein